jgi:leucyl-tRNA synthetase
MEYNFTEIEKKWQDNWRKQQTFKAEDQSTKPKYYVLDMFPYPSGAGLHVGHPLGYIATDIMARFKRHQGYNVLHPMGYDSFGLPAEQYAIQTGQHPAITTEQNIARYREQLDKIGFSFDWTREVRTSDPAYYKWTQWIFIQLFNSWYNKKSNKAETLDTLISVFEKDGNASIDAVCDDTVTVITAQEWKAFSELQKAEFLMQYRIAYLGEAYVNWCPQLGTVLANDEVKDGVSERGGYPVERKLMKQWSMRISSYSQRLLDGLDTIDWPESLKESQRYWIGKSEGTSLRFKVNQSEKEIEVFTTRPDTIFGVSFLTLAPEHEWVSDLTTAEQKAEIDAYVTKSKNRSERERQADVTTVSGVFTGSYAIHPFNGNLIPIWIGDYVLAGYGTGAVMAVPGHDSRDYAFAKQFQLPILEVVAGGDLSKESYDAKEGQLINSDFLNGLDVKDALKTAIKKIESLGLGKGRTNYRLRDAVFGRQRYWGEPIPIYYKDGIAHALPENELPLILPEVDKFLPTEEGEPPLARAKDWKYKGQYDYESTTMPGWAGSSWYFLRYMDATNASAFAAPDKMNYWQNVDLYIGGSEHATGHLLYVRFWTKFLNDLGHIAIDEPAKKLINQGMIQGTSAMIHRVNGEDKIVSAGLKNKYQTTAIHIDVNIVENNVVNVDALRVWRDDFKNTEFELEDGKLVASSAVEKMSKRWYNVVTPDSICERFGADTLRLYEMFLGPLEQSKPWNTNGITGVSGFLKKLWRLFYGKNGFSISDEAATKGELKTLHKTIKKISEDLERFSFNTSVSSFMICVNELGDQKCNKRAILEPLLVLISPYAPHIAEELWQQCGHAESIALAPFPAFNEAFLIEDNFSYPISFNGKMKFNIELPLTLSPQEIEKEVLSREEVQKHLNGASPKKVIIVPKKIVNIVI